MACPQDPFQKGKALKALKKVQVLKQSYVLKTRFRREKALKALKKVQVFKQSYVLKTRFRREKALRALKKVQVLISSHTSSRPVLEGKKTKFTLYDKEIQPEVLCERCLDRET